MPQIGRIIMCIHILRCPLRASIPNNLKERPDDEVNGRVLDHDGLQRQIHGVGPRSKTPIRHGVEKMQTIAHKFNTSLPLNQLKYM